MKDYFLWLAKTLTLLVIFVVVLPLLMVATASITQESIKSSTTDSKNSVAVIELNGSIESSKEIVSELYKQANNKKIKGIVLRINSPGGSVAPSQDIYTAVKKIKEKKPVVASMESVAASGGLYAALSASKIFCQPGTLTGSIGVIMQLPNIRKITELIGFEMITIKSGELKDVGNLFRDMTAQEKEFLQQKISHVYQDFVQAVVDGRGIARADVEKFADGRVILGSEAKELKLIDEYGDLDDAARAVFDILGKPLGKEESPDLFYPSDKFAQFRKLLDSVTSLPRLLERSIELKYSMQ